MVVGGFEEIGKNFEANVLVGVARQKGTCFPLPLDGKPRQV